VSAAHDSVITREIAAARRRIRTHVEHVRRHLLTIERDIERGTSPTGEASNAAALLGRMSEDAGALRVLLDLASISTANEKV
jgi:hypothetical protein